MYLQMRDNKYLENLLYDIWETYFCDVPRQNAVVIKFGKHSKRQLGCIRLIKDKENVKRLTKNSPENDIKTVSLITITKYFSRKDIPENIVKATIAHELCHYAHGFNSPLQQIYDKPHKGGVVTKELKKRGLGEMNKEAKRWLKKNWILFISN